MTDEQFIAVLAGVMQALDPNRVLTGPIFGEMSVEYYVEKARQIVQATARIEERK